MTERFDTYLAGDPGAVEAASQWLASLKETLSDAGDNTGGVRAKSNHVWLGRAGDAYRDFNGDMGEALDETSSRSRRAEDLFMAYAQQLGWRQQDMQECRDEAIAGGLVVDGTWIVEPEVVLRPADPDPKASLTLEQRREYARILEEYDRYAERSKLYLALQERTAKIFRRLEDWVSLNLQSASGELATPGLTAAMSGALTAGGLAASYVDNRYSTKAEALLEHAAIRGREAAQRASGNPAVRAGVVPCPNPSSVEKRVEAHPDTALGKTASSIGKVGKRVGGIVTVAAVGLEISQGASPSEVIVGVAGGAVGASFGVPLGAAVGGAVLGGITLGPELVVTVPVGAAIGAAGGGLLFGSVYASSARYAYTNFVPQHIRDMADEGLSDSWDELWKPRETLFPSDVP